MPRPTLLNGYDCKLVLPPLESLPVKASTYVVHRFADITLVSSALPVTFAGFAPHKPAITPYNVEGSLRKRLFHRPPVVGDLGTRKREYRHRPDKTLDGRLKEPSRKLLYRRLAAFVLKWCQDNLKPLQALPSFDEAIEHTHYSRKRKEGLRQVHEKANPADFRKYKVKCFVKDETYEEYKFPRMISSREDRAKTLLLPIFKAIEDEIYRLPWFVKGLTSQQRIEKINSVFGHRDVYVTDYSAFETHFIPDLMNSCEMVVYDYMLQRFPKERKLVHYLAKRNHLVSKLFHGTIEGVRMSGEMNTSLGNGISNLLLMKFAAYMTENEVLNCVVEGDDGLFELRYPIVQEFFADMGLELKCARTKPYIASFCGCVYNPSTLTNMRNPVRALTNASWCKHKYMKANQRTREELVKAYAYSLLAEYPGVPLVWKYCKEVMGFITRKLSYARARRYFDLYWQEALVFTDEIREPCQDDRDFFARTWGIPVVDQLKIEEELIIGPSGVIDSPTLQAYVPGSSLRAWQHVV